MGPNFVIGSDGRSIHPPGDEKTSDPIKKMSVLSSNMENIALNFKQGMSINQMSGQTMGQGGMLGGNLAGGSIGLADKHFKPIEVEAKKIKDSQKSNLGYKLKQLEFLAQQQQMS